MNLLNTHAMNELQELMEPNEFMEFIHSAELKIQHQMPDLLEMIASQQWENARRLAHQLKGTLGSLGCERLYASLHHLEEALRQAPSSQPQAHLVTEVVSVAKATQHALQQLLGSTFKPRDASL
jgi:HPt (histidine-containing phosphotransfer) domain-containing protein